MVMMLGVLLAASSMLVGCSDDDYPKNVMGAIVVNSLQTTSTSATAYWTVVSNGSCDGYKVVINEGTRSNKGAEVVNKTFAPKEYTSTFTGLAPNTAYVITTQAIPSPTSGRTEADTYEMEFTTAPLVSGITFGTFSAYTDVETEDVDEEGNAITVTEKIGSVAVSWNAIDASNCAGYVAALEAYQLADPKQPESDENKYSWKVVSSKTVSSATSTSTTFSEVVAPATKYRASVTPRPANSSWYANGEATVSAEVTSPAAD